MEQTLGSSSVDVLAIPVQGGPGLSTGQRQAVDLTASIPGWGSDLASSTRPGVPRDKAPDIGVETLYPPIEPQTPRIRIHKSTEHARLTPVFGTSCPPSGISGRIRDFAYRYSEGRRIAHWLMLMLADRVNVVEGLVDDVAHRHVPNIPKEVGLKSAWKHNPGGVVMGGLATALVVAAVVAYSRRDRAQGS